jgi:hypothetical protein
VEIFPDVHRVIAQLKSWSRGTHTHVSGKHLKSAIWLNLLIALTADLNSIVIQSLIAW